MKPYFCLPVEAFAKAGMPVEALAKTVLFKRNGKDGRNCKTVRTISGKFASKMK